jgi:transposase
MSRREELWKMARSGLAMLVDLVLRLEAELVQMRQEITALKDRLALNSRNSSKPPSTDGLDKPAPKSLRKKTGRRPGGQPGHPGRSLQQIAQPDQTIVHLLDRCPCGKCQGRSLRQEPVLDYEKRQVFELPAKPLAVTEHQAEIKRCPISGDRVTASFPPRVTAPAQYGPRFRALLLYFSNQQFIPYHRLAQLCQDLYGQPLSEATIVAGNERAYANLQLYEETVKTQLPQAHVNHCDESGLRVAGQLYWLHVVSNAHLTFYGVHPKRGSKAMDDLDIIPHCKNWIVHDHFKAYFTYEDCLHALCNEHHLRELKFLWEEHQEAWADELSGFLLESLQCRKLAGAPDEKTFKKILAGYHAILAKGRLHHPGNRGAQSKAANLLDRLESYDLSVLAFLCDPEVPFTNNQGERDIRMEKVRQKISGCFRTFHGAKVFARIRGYISTCRKQGRNLLEELENAILGNPFVPSLPNRAP